MVNVAVQCRLVIDAGCTYFSDAATVATFRNRCINAAVLHRRWDGAPVTGVDFLYRCTDCPYTWHDNMVRAFTRLLLLRCISE